MTLVETLAQTAETATQRLINRHIGGKETLARRTWNDEVGAEVVAGVNEVVHLWLPPVLLARWNIAG